MRRCRVLLKGYPYAPKGTNVDFSGHVLYQGGGPQDGSEPPVDFNKKSGSEGVQFGYGKPEDFPAEAMSEQRHVTFDGEKIEQWDSQGPNMRGIVRPPPPAAVDAPRAFVPRRVELGYEYFMIMGMIVFCIVAMSIFGK